MQGRNEGGGASSRLGPHQGGRVGRFAKYIAMLIGLCFQALPGGIKSNFKVSTIIIGAILYGVECIICICK